MARIYHVLKQNDEGVLEAYAYTGRIEASNPEQAIRLTAIDEGTGRYVAVPDGNWTSIGVRVEIPAPRVIFENEPQASEDELSVIVEDGVVLGSAAANDPDTLEPEQPEILDDEAFQERKAELAARRAGQ